MSETTPRVKIYYTPRDAVGYQVAGDTVEECIEEFAKLQAKYTTVTSQDISVMDQQVDQTPTPSDDTGIPDLPPTGNVPVCDCGTPMTQRQGKYGPFYGCANFPKGCKKIIKI